MICILEQIFEYMNQLVNEKNFQKATMILTNLGKVLVNADRVSFWYWDRENKQYWTIAASDGGKIVVEEGSGIVGACISQNQSIMIHNPYEDLRFNSEVDKKTGYLTKSILCMPVTDSKNEVIGAFQAINKIGEGENPCFDDEDKKRMTLACVYSGKHLESYMMNLEASTDPLTKLSNRRGFYDYLVLCEKPVSFIMCDIDFFKKVNDTYGHNGGDEVLKTIAGILTKHTKDYGKAFRWGGEEFLLCIHVSDGESAFDIAEKIRKQIEATTIDFEQQCIKVTMSLGVKDSVLLNNVEQELSIVDAKLYEAKKNGRNKVVI